LLRRAQRASRSPRLLSSLTVTVGMVIPRYYPFCSPASGHGRLVQVKGIDLAIVG
jgi:hypothetical protein